VRTTDDRENHPIPDFAHGASSVLDCFAEQDYDRAVWRDAFINGLEKGLQSLRNSRSSVVGRVSTSHNFFGVRPEKLIRTRPALVNAKNNNAASR
jgi:hypothetical protein